VNSREKESVNLAAHVFIKSIFNLYNLSLIKSIDKFIEFSLFFNYFKFIVIRSMLNIEFKENPKRQGLNKHGQILKFKESKEIDKLALSHRREKKIIKLR
jgi:hypothetical protein